MRKTVEFAAVFVLVASVTLAGCSEQSPMTISDGPATTFFKYAPAPGFEVVRRDAPLPDDLTVTVTVGPEGGRLEIAQAGVALDIPAGALAKPTEITMTAIAGDAAAVLLEPRNLALDVAAELHLRVEGTSAAAAIQDAIDGSALYSVLGVSFNGDPRHGVEPIKTMPTVYKSGSVVVTVAALSGYATASG